VISEMASVLLLVLALAAPIASRRLTGDVCGPLAIVALTWGASAALALLAWIPYHPIAPGTWRFIAINLVALAAGLMAGGRLAPRTPKPDAGAAAADWLEPQRWIVPFALVGLAGLGWYLVAAAAVLGWRGLLDGERLRAALTTYEIPSTFLVAQFFCLVAPLVAGALAFSGARLSWPQRIAATAAGLGTAVTTDRTQAFSFVATIFLMWVFARGPALGWRRLLLVGAVVPAILAANFVAVDAWRRNVLEAFELKLTVEGPESRSTPLARAFWRRMTSAYFYTTSSYPALDRLLADPGPSTGGAVSFYPVVRALERAGLAGPTPPYIPGFVTITRPGQDPPAYSNAYSYLGYPLRDFGVAGSVIYSAVLGVVCGAVFAWGRAGRGSPGRLLLVGQVSTAIAFLPLFNKFNNTAWWYVLAWTLVPFAVAALRGRRRLTTPA
jgi:hypothetical protein